ncbi:MAG: hypothetical protein GY861_21820 [bacterium]|nr:hypothetical protein [bacterium]
MNEYEVRLGKLKALRDSGVDPYPSIRETNVDFSEMHSIESLRKVYNELEWDGQDERWTRKKEKVKL